MSDREAAALAGALAGLVSGMVQQHLQAHQTRREGDAPGALAAKLNGGSSALIGPHYSDVLTRERALAPEARILDLGCGYGRIALALERRLDERQRYFGLDPNADAIDWAHANIGARSSNFRFARLDVHSKPYNPDGALAGAQVRLPFADGSLDRVFMISVLTHVDLDTVRNYVAEAARVLNPTTGRFVATFFLLDDEAEQNIGAGRSAFTFPHVVGASRVENADDPELAIAHRRSQVEAILRDAGLVGADIRRGNWSGAVGTSPVDFQDLVVVDLGDPVVAPPSEEEAREADQLARLAEVLTEHDHTSRSVGGLLEWAASITANLRRWEAHGLRLDPIGAGHETERSLGAELLHEVDFSSCFPPRATEGAYVPIGEEALLSTLASESFTGDRANVVALIETVAKIGLSFESALREHPGPVLRAPDGSIREAPIPPHEARGSLASGRRGLRARIREAVRRRRA